MVDVITAAKQVKDESKYSVYFTNYYEGDQPLTYTTRKYRDIFAKMVANYQENMCPAVVDPTVDRLEVIGMEVEGSDSNNAGERLWKLWRDNRMARKSRNVHQKALITGNSFVLVWPDVQGLPVITPQFSDNFTVHYRDDNGEIDWACKCWIDGDKKEHVTIYYADRIERWISQGEVNASTNSGSIRYSLLESRRNPYEKVPVFHFANNAPKGVYGVSELKDVVPVQDALNKAVADLLIAMEYAAYNQRWATGIELEDSESDEQLRQPKFRPGIDRLWASENEQANFGEFTAADLDKFINVHDMFVQTIARVTGTPMHYMLINTSVFPSGESLKTAEQRFVSKVKDRQVSFGETWEDVMTFAAQIARIALTEKVSVEWQLAMPRSETEFTNMVPFKKQMGISNEQLQREYGYTEAQIAQIKAENEAAQERSIDVMQRSAPPQNTREAEQ